MLEGEKDLLHEVEDLWIVLELALTSSDLVGDVSETSQAEHFRDLPEADEALVPADPGDQPTQRATTRGFGRPGPQTWPQASPVRRLTGQLICSSGGQLTCCGYS